MRALDPAFAAHIASGATTLATCWRLTRADGVVLGFTDHDLPLSFGGADFLPATGLDGGEESAKLGPQIDTSEVVGILSSAAITEDDILLGRYDGALVETFRVNWRDVAVRDLVRQSTIGEITREDGQFRAELRSGQQALNVPRGRLYQALCDAVLGDARCTVDLADARYRAAAEVTAIRDRYRLEVGEVSGFDAGWFGFGMATWGAGRRAGIKDQILGHARVGGADIFQFAAPVGDWVVVGDALTALAGCDRRFATCRDKFANTRNFRGFPHIPGNDFVLSYPKAGSVLNGEPLVK
ncbi:MAG: DUF2163 domain-containing protein [Devosia sp.]|nr:DUF2163 domain-containing protein [Devosia sp.]